jgi:hypothetical protein
VRYKTAIMVFAAAGLAVQLAVPAQAAAAAHAATVAVSPEMSAVCARISALVIPSAPIEGRIDRMLPELVKQMIASDPDIAEMESAYPGLGDAMVTAWRPIMIKAGREVMPLYRDDMAAMYCRNFSLPELREIEAFLGSPAFQALQASAYQNLTLARTTGDLLDDKDVSATSIQGDLAETGIKASRDLSAEHQRQITQFMQSPLGRKMAAMSKEKLAIDAKWTNYLPPWAEKEIETVTIDAMIAHIAKTDPKMAQQMRNALSEESGAAKRN